MYGPVSPTNESRPDDVISTGSGAAALDGHLSQAIGEQVSEMTIVTWDDLVRSTIESVAVQAVRELADALLDHSAPYVRVDPFVQIMTGLADDVIPALCRGIVRDAVTEIVNDILLRKRCDLALRGIEEEVIADIMHASDIFEIALEEEDEASAVLGLLEEVLSESACEDASSALRTYQAEAFQLHSDHQRLAVDAVVRRVVCRRIAVGHLMMSISNHFAAVLLEHHTYGLALRLAIERLLVHLYAVENRLDFVTESDICEHAFAEAAIPVVQEELIKMMLSVSRELEDRIDELEDQISGEYS